MLQVRYKSAKESCNSKDYCKVQCENIISEKD